MCAKAWAAAPFKASVSPDPHAADHVADLADDVVGEQPSRIVFQDGVNHAVHRHAGSPPDEDLRAGESADQRVDRRLGGEGRQKHSAGGRRLGVGVRKPGAQGRHGRVEEKGDEDQGERRDSRDTATCPRRRATRSGTSGARSLRAGTNRRRHEPEGSGSRRLRRAARGAATRGARPTRPSAPRTGTATGSPRRT